MTVFNRVRDTRNTAADVENPQMPLTSSALLDFLGIEAGHAGKRVNQMTVLGLPAVWRAMALTASVPAALPFDAFKAVGAARELMGDRTQAQQLMANPHPDMTRFEFWQTVHMQRRGWGNAYLFKNKNGAGQTVNFWHVHPSTVQVGRPGGSRSPKVFLVNDPDYGTEVYTENEILHLPGMGYDGICGVSPIRAMKESVGLGLAAQEFGARLFGSGTLASGVLQTEQRLTQKQAEALQSRWQQKHRGLQNAHETIVLDKGAKFTPLTIPPEDAQFLQTRHFQIAEVCRWFGIPPFLMFETEGSTSWGTGLEQQALAWVKFDLSTDLVPVEQRVSRLLYPSPAYAKHNVEGLLRGDTAARAAFYTAMWNIGVLSTNEIRALEEMSPVEHGDVRYRGLNMGELGTADTASTSTTSTTTTSTPAGGQ